MTTSTTPPRRPTACPTVEDQALASAFTPASLGDLVWHDLDADGKQDPGEPGIAGVTVQLHDEAGTLLATTATDADGHYHFTNLDPGGYRIRFLALAGMVVSPAHVGAADGDSDPAADGWTAMFDLVSGADDLTLDAGIHEPPTTPPTGPGEPSGPDAAAGGAGRGADPSGSTELIPALAFTGSSVATLILLGVVLVGGGAFLLWVRPRRRRRSAFRRT